jgi:hypothetical protein
MFSFFTMAQRTTRHYAIIWMSTGAIKIAAFHRRCVRNDRLLAHSTNTFDAVCQENSDPRLPVSVPQRIGCRAATLMMDFGSSQPTGHATGKDRRCRLASDSLLSILLYVDINVIYK